MTEKENKKMEEIVICERPEWVSFEDIHHVLVMAHAGNSHVVFETDNLTREKLDQNLENGGTVFVAIDGRKVVGTMTIAVETKKRWYVRGNIGRLRYIAVLPDYSRRNIASGLVEGCAEWAQKCGLYTLFWTTAANNAAAIATARKNGFYLVDYFHFKNTDHDSIGMVRWHQASWLRILRGRMYYYWRRRNVISQRNKN